jgi:hypothetical protein
MKILKIAGFLVLILWMAFVTWRLENIREIALQTCAMAYADVEGWNLKNGHHPPSHPPICPFIDLAHGP